MENRLLFFIMFSFIMIFVTCCSVTTQQALNSSFTSSGVRCLPHISSALLQLKQEFVFKKPNYTDYYYYPIPSNETLSYPKMRFWKEGKDCCEWDGVTCSTKIGQVIGLDLSLSWLQGPLHSNSSLFSLSQLHRLNLAYNNFTLSNIPSSFAQLSRLTHLNLSHSFFSGQVPSEIALLSNLMSLDLSSNFDYDYDREMVISLLYSPTIAFAQNMTKLRELHLNSVNLSSLLPESMANLSSLTSLSLRDCNLYGEFLQNIFHLPNIQVIDVSSNQNLNGILPYSIGDLKFLSVLHLSKCNFSGTIPSSIKNISHLSSLDLSSNNFDGQLPPALFTMPSLQSLSVSFNRFTGPLTIPSSVKNLSHLSLLDLSFNNFDGQLPPALFIMSSLQYLRLDDNHFNGPLTIPSSVKNLSHLSSLELSFNNFDGQLPPTLFIMPSLQSLGLSSNQFTGPLTIPNVSLSSQLAYLNLDENKLTGKIPRSIFEMQKLKDLYLSDNNLSGIIEMSVFSKLSQLRSLFLSRNSLVVVENTTTNSTLNCKLNYLDLASCNITEFPKFLKTQNELQELYLSNNKIEGKIPKWFFTIGAETLRGLNLSTNFITGWEQVPKVLPWKALRTLDLSHNMFRDTLPAPPFSVRGFYISNNNVSGKIHPLFCNLTNLESLDMSNNNLSGEILPCLGSISSLRELTLSGNKFEGSIPSSLGNLTWLYLLDLSKNRLSGRIPRMGNNSLFCNLRDLLVLDVSNNQLSGSIPQCLGSFSHALQALIMKENNFSGEMPQTFLNGSSLITLDLSHNQLEGMVPQSLTNCNALEILNLGYNQLSGTFHFWLQNLASLQVLVLRSNKFHGPIWDPKKFMGFEKLLIVDLSFNKFNGTLSSDYFANWSAINTHNNSVDKSKPEYIDDGHYYLLESVIVTNKGFEMEYVRILTIFTCIDLSNNNFHGEIPKSIGDLQLLIVLNLSSNNFEGHIPLSIGNLKEIESLDLSNNKLSGRIPQELAALTFLECLNLSNNQLTGPIPQGTQISTLPNSSFYGNEELCGFPLSKECDSSDESPSTLEHESEFESGFGWKAVLVGYGCGFLGGLLGGYFFISKI
ncbi:receptor-like protein 35 [Humulus lupulus]|uniref:receptor-like protein 35 n=1 Tax=Humulus lupulus TaxID=3486 RepID=UPI002B41024A|nr:receptor-like protein 35 [Humulus lupulus]